MQNKEEVLLVSFLFSTDHFCWVENDENFESSKKVRFDQVFFTNAMPSVQLLENHYAGHDGIEHIEICNINFCDRLETT